MRLECLRFTMICDPALDKGNQFSPMHPRIHDPGHIKGVRTVATIELTKGIIVALAGLGLFSMRHKDIWGLAESFLDFIHANPHHHLRWRFH